MVSAESTVQRALRQRRRASGSLAAAASRGAPNTWSARSAWRSARSCWRRCRLRRGLAEDHQEAAAIPPTYFPHHLSLDSYGRLWHYQAGLPTYLFNSGGAALLTIAFCLALTIPAGYALARFPVPGKELSSSSCCSR